MNEKYYHVDVKPQMVASKLALGAFTGNDLLFDWASFKVPTGTWRLVGVTAIVGPAVTTAQRKALSLEFGRNDQNGAAPDSLGVVHAAHSTGFAGEHLIGNVQIAAGDYVNGIKVGFNSATCMAEVPNVTFTPELNQQGAGVTNGFETYYVAGIATGTVNFKSTVFCTGSVAATQKVVGSLDDGSGSTADILKKFRLGDIIHNADDEVVGTIASLDSATQFTCVDNVAVAQVNNDELVNVTPITLRLTFEC
tara:strand:- start:53 stop:805 length:753 start_codon:yes stop_codon:yes gene_type:complete